MEILETKLLGKKVSRVELYGVMSTFHGDTAGIISNQNRRGFNVVIAYNLREIKPENYVLPTMVSRERAKEIYHGLK